MHKTFTPSGTKSFPLTFQNIFERCTQYMTYISLSFSLYLYPRDMHLEEISRLLEYHCNHSVCLREWICISYRVYFQQWLAEATSSCTVQSEEFLALWLSLLFRWVKTERLSFFLWHMMVLKKLFTTMTTNDNCPLKHHDWC